MQVVEIIMKEIKKRSGCPVSSSLDLFGDKWSLLIVRDLMYYKKCTYGDFLKSDEKIATNILAARLSTLEDAGIIVKLDHPESKVKFLYQLSEKGINLLPVLIEMYIWGEKYFMLSEHHIEFLKEIKKDKQAFIDKLTGKMKKAIVSK
ncbi:winged helix-turn-helix transcriptional regulator [Flavobacterium johnsoniae]|uniref:Transcriptional regulator, HxlR family n=1 Tax=Flavobacterium johnsoniae (strain ATCC 17061 / DSM 2064 / JCM 8514 / BCRC 14874 / CCUG 350202 / NBRC 14942 / NCIMB 11054 / UW101) TaxID=376686 RepID=A5FFA8_FLAJ1|nr:helix-turn-helix domain-containing protein [Flavobacterium johnsoniae]ABQ06116.1 transcriptional regulator, HxlR family [Flavobacterium johnsoniae UW101]WQG81862.1 helix-turn-helix domain-containing protein [Flavobacterium johnsoniae UW101]SHK66329.1 transcriptional regulator, HxlR family [Flavobacterium johnsoniae]